jgi:hypothetical protein
MVLVAVRPQPSATRLPGKLYAPTQTDMLDQHAGDSGIPCMKTWCCGRRRLQSPPQGRSLRQVKLCSKEGREPVLRTNLKAKVQPSLAMNTRSEPTTPARTAVHAHCHDHVQTDSCIVQHRKATRRSTISLHKDVAAKRDALTIPSPTEAPGARKRAPQLSSSNATSASTCKWATSKFLYAAELRRLPHEPSIRSPKQREPTCTHQPTTRRLAKSRTWHPLSALPPLC